MTDDNYHNQEGTPRKRPRRGSPGKDGLTPKRRAYVAARIAGAAPADAYRMSADVNKSDRDDWRAAAWHIEQNAAVRAALERAQQQIEAGQVWDTRRIRAFVHAQLLQEATTGTSPAARVKALELLGKQAGMFTGKQEAPPVVSVTELRARLRAKLLELQGQEVPSPGLSGNEAAPAAESDGQDGGDVAEPQAGEKPPGEGAAPP